MVLPWIGTRDFLDQLGYVIERCPACETVGAFAVLRAQRKLTVIFVPTVAYGQQQVLECRTCQARFQVPPEQFAAIAKRVMTHEQLVQKFKEARLRIPGALGHAGNPTAKRTLYQTLQVDPDADPEVIEAAFKRLALKYHPDTSTAADAADRMRELLEAKSQLGDPRKRAIYDRSIGIVRAPPPAPPPPPRPKGDALRPEDE